MPDWLIVGFWVALALFLLFYKLGFLALWAPRLHYTLLFLFGALLIARCITPTSIWEHRSEFAGHIAVPADFKDGRCYILLTNDTRTMSFTLRTSRGLDPIFHAAPNDIFRVMYASRVSSNPPEALEITELQGSHSNWHVSGNGESPWNTLFGIVLRCFVLLVGVWMMLTARRNWIDDAETHRINTAYAHGNFSDSTDSSPHVNNS